MRFVFDLSCGEPDLAVRRAAHRLIADVTAAMDDQRLNVAIARLMELTNVLRKAIDSVGAANPAVRESAEALVRMLSCFAPFTAEEGWQRLGHEPSVSAAEWPLAEPDLLIEATAICVVQINGKVRGKVDVPADITESDLFELVLATDSVRTVLGGAGIEKVIVRAPKLINFVVSRQRQVVPATDLSRHGGSVPG